MHPEPLELGVTITVRGDEMDLDFTAPPQVRAGNNLIFTGLLATVYYAVKTVAGPYVPPNAGIARPLRVTAKKGTVLNCEHPAAVSVRTSTAQRVVDIIHGALAQIIPERITAAGNGSLSGITFSGRRPSGDIWIYLESIAGGSGARYGKDGLDGVNVHMTNTSNLPVEALEGEYPLTVLRCELVSGSGGAGAQRGGMAIRRVYRAEAPCLGESGGTRG